MRMSQRAYTSPQQVFEQFGGEVLLLHLPDLFHESLIEERELCLFIKEIHHALALHTLRYECRYTFVDVLLGDLAGVLETYNQNTYRLHKADLKAFFFNEQRTTKCYGLTQQRSILDKHLAIFRFLCCYQKVDTAFNQLCTFCRCSIMEPVVIIAMKQVPANLQFLLEL